MSKDEAPRSIADIQADLAASRATLVSSVEGLIDDLRPKNMAKRAVSDAKSFVSTEFENAKQQVKDENGWRVDRLISVGGAILGAVAFVFTVRMIVNRSRGRALLSSPRKQLTSGE